MKRGLYKKAEPVARKTNAIELASGIKELFVYAETFETNEPTLMPKGFDRAAYQRDYMRKRRAEAKKAKETE